MRGLLLLCLPLIVVACSKDEDEPVIYSVWTNMTAAPAEQVTYAYPGQTLCLRGSGLGELRKLNVNGTLIDITKTQIYDTDNCVFFKLPADISTTGDYIKVVTRYGEVTYRPFIVRPASVQPKITKFSATTLVAGRTLTITGQNLEGAAGVWLPTPFDGSVKCELDTEKTNTETTVYAVIPTGAKFAKGQCRILMQKSDSVRGITYRENVYSAVTDFRN